MVYFPSDMSSAFYLFKIPSAWAPMLAFNIAFKGEQLGQQDGVLYRPACSVIPMGWSSSVSIMREIADRLRLPNEHKVRKLSPLPQWLTEVVDEAAAASKPWFHVYLDNFCAMEKGPVGFDPCAGNAVHKALERAWEQSGVVSSSKKRVAGVSTVHALGTDFDGD